MQQAWFSFLQRDAVPRLFFFVVCAESDVNFGAQADKDGRYILNGHVGQQLIIEARSDRQYVPLGSKFEPMERCETVRVTLEKPQETIRVVITKLR